MSQDFLEEVKNEVSLKLKEHEGVFFPAGIGGRVVSGGELMGEGSKCRPSYPAVGQDRSAFGMFT